MNLLSKAKITAIGAYAPPKVMTNDDFSKFLDTDDEWISSRTGIKQRCIADDNTFASDLGVKAVENLVETYKVAVDDVDMVIVTTFTPDMLTPSVAAIIQGQLGLAQAGVIDLNAACAGFVHGLFYANALVSVGQCKKVLVIATEAMSKILDFEDRTTCVLFGDGASAVLVEHAEEGNFLATFSGAAGELGDKLYCTSVANKFKDKEVDRVAKLFQDGRGVYNYVIKNVPKAVQAALDEAGMTMDELDWFVPHSANMRMIQSITKKMKFPMEKTLYSVVDYGNTSSASIPLALWEADKAGKLKKGDKMLLCGFGGGLNHATVIIKW